MCVYTGIYGKDLTFWGNQFRTHAKAPTYPPLTQHSPSTGTITKVPLKICGCTLTKVSLKICRHRCTCTTTSTRISHYTPMCTLQTQYSIVDYTCTLLPCSTPTHPHTAQDIHKYKYFGTVPTSKQRGRAPHNLAHIWDYDVMLT